MLHPVSDGAITQLYAGTSPEITVKENLFLEPWARQTEQRHPQGQNEKLAAEQWEWCDAQVRKVKSQA